MLPRSIMLGSVLQVEAHQVSLALPNKQKYANSTIVTCEPRIAAC